MIGAVNLLLVEDSEDDAKLLLRALARSGIETGFERVDSADKLRTVLRRATFDAVISDYNLPGFNGLEAMRIVRETGIDLPFILVSGVVGEELAVRAMKLGASDFVLKRNLDRLGPVLAREIGEARQRAAARQLQHDFVNNEKRYRQVVEALPEAVYTCDAQGRITMFNQAAADLWGTEPRILEDLWEGFSKAFNSNGEALLAQDGPMAMTLRSGKPTRGIELTIERPDGSRRQVLPHPDLLFDAEGTLVGAVCMMVDITDRKNYETELALGVLTARALFDESPVAQVMLLPNMPINAANRMFQQLTGYSKAEIVGSRIEDRDLLDAAERAQFRQCLEQGGGDLDEFETTFRRKDGQLLNVLLSSRTVRVQGKLNRITSVTDITERKRANESAWLSQQCLDAVSEGVLIAGPDRRAMSVNPAFTRLTGYAADEIVGKPCSMLQGPQTDPATVQAIRLALEAGQPFTGEILNYTRSGAPFWNELSLSPVRNDGGDVRYFVGIQRDISERKRGQAELRLSAQVFAQSAEGITVTDAQGNILVVNKAFTVITGFEPHEVIGRNPKLLASGRQGASFYKAMWRSIYTHGSWRGEIWNRRKQGQEYPEWLTITALLDDEGKVCNYVGTFRDISQQKAADDKIERLSNFDTLTGLPNRSLLEDRCRHDIATAQRHTQPLAMLMVAIDDFRLINETMGHAHGDELLQQVARLLEATARGQDTLSRIGGNDFALVLPNETPDGAAAMAERMFELLCAPFLIGDAEVLVTASIGIATYPDDGKDFGSLFQAAQFAVDEAKGKGDRKHRFYNAKVYETTKVHSQIGAALRGAIRDEQFSLHYQPFADLRTGEIAGAEALLRWTHSELGRVSPALFIPVSERNGSIIEIGNWVIDRACADLRRGLDEGLPMVPVSVNVSPVQFRDALLIPQLRGSLHRHGIDPALLCVEVTEGALIRDVEHSKVLLHELKTLGVRLSLDDFGTGYSSLSYLKLFPFDKVKIDQSFVRDITVNSQDAVIAKVVISMAHGLGLQVIAEGVETEVQCEFMRNNSCDEIQGYFFARPAPFDEFKELLARRHALPAHLVQLQSRARTLLLVDDEPNVVAALRRLLRLDGYQILTASNGTEGLAVLANRPVDIILSDQRMPGMTGVEFLRQAKRLYPDTIRIVLSGYTELQSVTDAINEGAVYRFLTKPWIDAQLRSFVEEAFRHKELADENRQLGLKVMIANQELAASNRQLQQVVDLKQRQIASGERNLWLIREALQNIPLPVLAVDDSGMIAFANTEAERQFSHGGPLAGSDVADALPEITHFLASQAEGKIALLAVGVSRYHAQWHGMGDPSSPAGKLVTLVPTSIPYQVTEETAHGPPDGALAPALTSEAQRRSGPRSAS